MEDSSTHEYLIPANVKSRFEFFEGWGLKELMITVLATLIGVAVCTLLFFVFWPFKWKVFVYLLVPLFTGIGFALTNRDPRIGRNALELIKDRRNYANKPNLYMYRHGSGRVGR